MTFKKTTRREFLRGASLRPEMPEAVAQTAPRQPKDPSSYILQLECDAMATRFAVYLHALPDSTAAESALRALDLIAQLEDQMTVYRDHSEVSQINRRAAFQEVAVEPQLMGLFETAVQLHKETGGAFDMTSGPLSDVWGFHRRQGRVPSPQELQTTLDRIGTNEIDLDSAACTIRFRRAGVQINLGGIGKGYALDRCAKLLLEDNVTDFMIHGGQSSVIAYGCRNPVRWPSKAVEPVESATSTALEGHSTGADAPSHEIEAPTKTQPPPKRWTVGVKHPLRPQERLAEVHLQNEALATSGSQAQFFYHQGKRLGHILDPRTGRPAEVLLSATVVAPTAAEADALATAFYVMGVEQSTRFCERHPSIGALLATPTGGPTGRRGGLQLHPLGLKDDQWKAL